MAVSIRPVTRTLEAPAVTPLAPPAARTLAGVFAATVAAWPDRVALDAAGATLTYRELDARARAFAARLAELGAGPGDRVGVRVASGTHELYVAILGTLLAGAAYVPVDADDPAARASAIWAQAGVCAVAGDGLALTPLAPPAGQAGRPPAPEDDAWIIFTSGSTGAPKGVAVTHRSAAAFVDAETRLWTVREDDRVLAGLSVGFDASCEEMWLAWRNGAALVPAPRALVRSGAELGPWLRAQDVSVVSTVPTLAALWDDDALAGVRLLILGGEALSAELAARLAAEGREVWNTYGPTEATVVTTATRVRAGAPVTIGAPLDGWQVAVVDPGTGAPVTPGEPGELVVAGVGLARYLDARLDAERYAALPALGWERAYRTGDIVRESPDGLVFVGRADDQVKIGGRRLELGEVEAQLAGAPGVRAAAVALQTTPGGNKVLAGYVVGHGAGAVDLDAIRAHLAQRLPAGVAPVLVALDELPVRASGKVDRAALPWPPPAAPGGDDASAGDADGTLGWLAGQWADQLGPLPMDAASDFFALGGTSLAVAKLVSRLRERFPAVAVADVYRHRRLGELAAHLDALGDAAEDAGEAGAAPRGRFALGQLGGLLGLFALGAVPWLAGILAYDDWRGAGAGPHLAWAWLAVIWLVVLSAPGRAGLVLLARRLLLGDITPGRHPRHGALALRLWLVERLADVCHLDQLAGTPWAVRYARALGHRVARDARLGTLPPVTARVTVGAGATIEPDVDLHGWWIEGGDLVIGEVRIGAGARVGTRALLMPGAEVGAGAEVEPGSVVTGIVPGGERWAGSPARYAGRAGESWPNGAPAPARRARAWRAMYGVGLAIKTLLPLLASAPGIALVLVAGGATSSPWGTAAILAATAPLVAASFVVAYALLVAAGVRAVAPLVRCGWHPDDGAVGWALWFAEGLMGGARETLFPLFSSVYTRAWLRLCGVEVGRRTEISTAVGLNRHVRFGETSFAADDVLFAGGRARWGWLHVAPVTVGDRTFLGNGALVRGGSRLGDDGLVGVLTVAPETAPDGTSWLGAPAIELPRVADRVDPARTTDPPRRLVVARGAVELVRILLPGTLSVAIASLVFGVLDTVGRADGGLVMALVATPVLLGGALLAAAATVAVKWLLMGRYARGEHPLWSWFVWRDEIVNSCQEQLAGTWLLEPAFGTPLLPAYLRAMGATVGRDVWCETLALTEFDLVTLGDGAVLNRNACVETHLFHDRLMRIGPALLGAGATLGPKSAVLPDTVVGDGASVGGRSVVLRGEELPPRTRWAGAPVERA